MEVGSYLGGDGGYFGTKSNHDFHLFTNDGTPSLTIATSGNVEVNGQIKISGGTPATDKVLTSDADGLATWKTPSSGMPTASNVGDMNYWNGSAWVVISTTANEGATLQMISGVTAWTGGTTPSIGDNFQGGKEAYIFVSGDPGYVVGETQG